MIEVLFTLNQEEHVKTHKVETAKELYDFMQHYKQKVLDLWPQATNIRLGKYIQQEY